MEWASELIDKLFEDAARDVGVIQPTWKDSRKLHVPYSLVQKSIFNELLDDVIIEILAWCVRLCQIEDHNAHMPRPYRWITVTHICHRWRAVALSAPALWSHVVPTRLESVSEFLRRSKQAPLSLRSSRHWVMASDCLQSVEAILREVHRIEHIELSVSVRLLLAMFSLQNQQAPQLRSVVLKNSDKNRQDQFSVQQLEEPIPFFSRLQPPAIRHLHLAHYPLVAIRSMLQWTSLRELILQSITQIPSILHLLDLLENITYLERLTLNYLDMPSDGMLPKSTTHHSVASLPHLQYLCIMGRLSILAAFLSRITLPHTARIRLDDSGISAATTVPYDVATMKAALSTSPYGVRSQSFGAQPLTSIVVVTTVSDMFNMPQVSFSAYGTLLSPDQLLLESNQPLVSISMTTQPLSRDNPISWNVFCEAFTMGGVHAVHIQGAAKCDRTFWSSMPNLQTVWLDRTVVEYRKGILAIHPKVRVYVLN